MDPEKSFSTGWDKILWNTNRERKSSVSLLTEGYTSRRTPSTRGLDPVERTFTRSSGCCPRRKRLMDVGGREVRWEVVLGSVPDCPFDPRERFSCHLKLRTSPTTIYLETRLNSWLFFGSEDPNLTLRHQIVNTLMSLKQTKIPKTKEKGVFLILGEIS